MHFTVNLSSELDENYDFSYGLAFIPCPVWMKGNEQVLNLNPEGPDYRLGSVKRLIEQEEIGPELFGAVHAHVILHPAGHGSAADLIMLQRDLMAEGFTVTVCGQMDVRRPFEAKES